jgi:chromosomal replication initiation ATPase DnaA
VFPERDGDDGKWIVLYLGRRQSRLTLRKLGEAMGGIDCSAVYGGIIRFEKKLKKDSELR